jgi:hypothetical protein
VKVENQLRVEAIGTEIKRLVADEVFHNVKEWYDWAKKQSASHHRLAVERHDQGDPEMEAEHVALSNAYSRLAEEINAVVRERDIQLQS